MANALLILVGALTANRADPLAQSIGISLALRGFGNLLEARKTT